MFTESLTRNRLIKFIFCTSTVSLVVFDIITISYIKLFYISRDGTSTDPNSITFHLSFLKYSTEYTYQYGVNVALLDDHADLYFVLKKKITTGFEL